MLSFLLQIVLIDNIIKKMTAEEKVKEIIEKYVNLPINFPYIDTEDRQRIGVAHMTYHSAAKCAKLEVEAIIKTNPSDIIFWEGVNYKIEAFLLLHHMTFKN